MSKIMNTLDELFRGEIHAFRRRKHAFVGQQGFKSVHRLDTKIIGDLIRGVSIMNLGVSF